MIDLVTGELEQIVNPISGQMMNNRKNVTGHEQVIDEMWFEASKTETAPTEYYVPAELAKSVALLQKHGLQMKQLTQPVKGVEQFTITSNAARPAANNIDTGAHELRSLDGAWAACPRQ